MFKNKSLSNEPFWIDEPNPYYHPNPSMLIKGTPSWWIWKTIWAYSIFFLLVIFGLLIIVAINYPVFWIFVAFEAITISARIFLPRFTESNQARAIRIQQHAKEQTGADYLGSAIHTAGHPLLQTNQPIVLALKDSDLSIYSYDSSTPIDTLSVNSILDVSPVVYDDEYIPHVGVIDNTAQALQISIMRQNIDYTCSFRRMYKLRPIEWFHVIQKARLLKKAG